MFDLLKRLGYLLMHTACFPLLVMSDQDREVGRKPYNAALLGIIRMFTWHAACVWIFHGLGHWQNFSGTHEPWPLILSPIQQPGLDESLQSDNDA